MDTIMVTIIIVVLVAISGIVLVATLSMPVAFAGTISALGIGVVTAIVRFWRRTDKGE